jgi:hypothetical protein
MLQPLWWNDRTFYEAIRTKAGSLVFERISHMEDRMAHVEFIVLADVRVQAHYIQVLDSLAFPRLIM